jgi:uncharacterized protein
MRFAESDDSNGYLVQAYGPEGIRIGARLYSRGLILAPQRIVEDWGPVRMELLDAGHIQPLIDLQPEVIVLGTGRSQVFPDPAVYAGLLAGRIGFEVMDTGAACRTYNILVSEGRRVVAALLPW